MKKPAQKKRTKTTSGRSARVLSAFIAGSESIAIDSAQVADALDDARRERQATERLKAASSATVSVADGGENSLTQLVVPVDESVLLLSRERTITELTTLYRADRELLRDMPLAERDATLFWNVVYHIGGADAICEHECSVAKACAAKLLPDEDCAFLNERARRKK